MSAQAPEVLASKPHGGTCKMCGHKVRTLHGLHIHLSTTHNLDWRKMKLSEYLTEAPPEPLTFAGHGNGHGNGNGNGNRIGTSSSSRMKALNPATVGWFCPSCGAVNSPQMLRCDCVQSVHKHA
jgi:hypothetical protein